MREKSNNRHEADRWLKQAINDLDDAEYCVKGERFHLCCFLSQQAAEKALKAYVYFKGAEFVFGHSVKELLQSAGKFEKKLKPLEKEGSFLDRFYIPTRYPNGLPGGTPYEAFNEKDASEAMNSAEKIIVQIKKLIKAPNPAIRRKK